MRFDRCAAFVVAALTGAGAAGAGPMANESSATPSADAQSPPGPISYPEDASAQYRLGRMYERGRGAPQDYGEARRWYLKAAGHDDAMAEFSLGVLAVRGLGAPKDDVEAVRWFRMAANQGVGAAQFNLGVMYMHSLGVRQDYINAYMWFSLANQQGEQGAQEALDDAAAKMAPAEIAIAERLVKEWKPSTWSLRL